MANFLTKFTSQSPQLKHQLRLLLHKGTPWLWDANTDKYFEEVKRLLSQVFAYFDSTKGVTLSVDASSNGLGAVLLQQGKPVAYASATL